MSDHELEETARQPVRLRQTEKAAQADAVRDHHPDHGKAEDNTQGEGEDRNVDVVDHDQARYLDALVLGDLRPELVMVHAVDQPRVRDRVGGVGVREDDEEADQRRDEHQRPRGEEVRPSGPVGTRQGLDVKPLDPFPHLAPAAVHDAVAARHEPIQVALHRLAWPVALGARQVGRGSPVERCQGQYLSGGERVEMPGAGAGEQVLEPVPVLAPQSHEVFSPHNMTIRKK